MGTRLITIGIGGASCSGKTSLAKHLARILSCPIVHQDDFAPPLESIPIHSTHGVADWDDPDTAIEWRSMVDFMESLRATGELGRHRSNDHLNEQVEIPIADEIEGELCKRFREVEQCEKVSFIVVDGFILYYKNAIIDSLDVRILLRSPRQVLKERRENRVYALQNEANTGETWTDPPGYFDNIVWPAYVKAHSSLFENGDVDGKPLGVVNVIEGGEMGAMVEQVCELAQGAVEECKGVLLP